MRYCERQLKYLRMMQSQQEAANCDPTKIIAAKNNQRLQIPKRAASLAGGDPHVVRTLLKDKWILLYAITVSPSAHELNNGVKNETSPSHFDHPIRHLLAFLSQLWHKYMCQKAITVNRGQEYQTLITVRPSEHWCKMQRISLNGFWDIMFTGMGQMDRPHETQHLLPQPSQEWRQERLKEPFNCAASVNFTSKKSCKNTNEKEYRPICRYFFNGSIYAGQLVARGRTRPQLQTDYRACECAGTKTPQPYGGCSRDISGQNEQQ